MTKKMSIEVIVNKSIHKNEKLHKKDEENVLLLFGLRFEED